MTTMKKTLALLTCMMLMNIGGAFAAPASVSAEPATGAELAVDYQKIKAPAMQYTYGEIVAIEDDLVIVKGEGHFKMVAVRVDKDTFLLSGKDGKAKKASSLRKGRRVTVYYSSKATRSMPPQTQAYAVVFGDHNERQGVFFPVEQVQMAEDGTYVKVLNKNNDLIATITGEACADFNKIKAGDNLLLWYNMVAMSIPGQTNAIKAVVL